MAESIAYQPDLDALEAKLGYSFKDRESLLVAITHRSFAHEVTDGNCEDNESYEFLGDAILSFVVADRLFQRFPGLDEGRLSKHKSMLEKASTLADAARDLGIGEFMRLGRGERRSGGALNDKIHANAFEALVAAIYLDGGLDAVKEFIEHALGQRIHELDGENPINDYKSALQEFTQGQGLGTPQYVELSEDGPDHDKRFTVGVEVDKDNLAKGCGNTKRGAQQVAAKRALEKLERRRATG